MTESCLARETLRAKGHLRKKSFSSQIATSQNCDGVRWRKRKNKELVKGADKRCKKNERALVATEEEEAASLLTTDALESISAVVLSLQQVADLICLINGFGGIRSFFESKLLLTKRRSKKRRRNFRHEGNPRGDKRAMEHADRKIKIAWKKVKISPPMVDVDEEDDEDDNE
ncbi:hypothetical protein Fmac_019144 [Flemingia macrophylla]|uniref:Uncharacterized protein n=1 Tax=Flemingia macrophylla TaxID=520843 RepID=A0ABD1M7M7_9FABA